MQVTHHQHFLTHLTAKPPPTHSSTSFYFLLFHFFASHASRARRPRGVARSGPSARATRNGRPYILCFAQNVGPPGACSDLFGFLLFYFTKNVIVIGRTPGRHMAHFIQINDIYFTTIIFVQFLCHSENSQDSESSKTNFNIVVVKYISLI